MTRNHLAQMAHKYMDYDMIGIHTDLPDFPEGRIRLLYAMLSQQPALSSSKDLLAVVASLVQMGLDTHDLVDDAPPSQLGGTVGMRARQLQVLAGDYFSSRFYSLLSQAGQIDMVRRLGDAICDINRIKVLFYTKMKLMRLDAEEYLRHGAELKSGLFLSFTHLMSGLYERLWPDVVERFSRCELLLQELARLEKPGQPAEGWGFWHVLQEGDEEDRRTIADRRGDPGVVRELMDKYCVSEKLGELLRQAVAQLQSLLQRFPSDKLGKELQALVQPFLSALGPLPKTAMTELG